MFRGQDGFCSERTSVHAIRSSDEFYLTPICTPRGWVAAFLVRTALVYGSEAQSHRWTLYPLPVGAWRNCACPRCHGGSFCPHPARTLLLSPARCSSRNSLSHWRYHPRCYARLRRPSAGLRSCISRLSQTGLDSPAIFVRLKEKCTSVTRKRCLQCHVMRGFQISP